MAKKVALTAAPEGANTGKAYHVEGMSQVCTRQRTTTTGHIKNKHRFLTYRFQLCQGKIKL
jgi:hypothetical protein